MKWCTHATGVPNWVLDPTEKVPEGFPEKVTLNWNWKDEWALARQGKEGTMFQAEGLTCTKQRTHWTENVFILLAREARFFQKWWLEGDECIVRFAFRKDHASAHWGLRPSGLSWRLTALLQSAAITLSREMAWWWPHCILTARRVQDFELQWYVVETARTSERAFCLRALFLLENLISLTKPNSGISFSSWLQWKWQCF